MDVEGLFSQIMGLFTLWRVIFMILVISNLKNLPLIWHLRILNALRFCMKTQRPTRPITSKQLFQPLITASHAPLMEIDFNLHKSNSSYFSDADIARTHLVCTLFSNGIEHMRGGTSALSSLDKPPFGLAIGAVTCLFRQELKPYEPYELWTRILSWDEKWLYIITHFVRKGDVIPKQCSLYPSQNSPKKSDKAGSSSRLNSFNAQKAVVATLLSRCVFKQGRRTVSPTFMLQHSGLIPNKSSDPGNQDEIDLLTPDSCSSSDSGIDMGDTKGLLELENIERKRQRGLRIAMAISKEGQAALELEFTGDENVLGRHSDGAGFKGVLSTLAQLARLKRDQVL